VAANLSYALRRLSRSPGFTAITLATVAIAVGANTAIFSVVNSVLIRPLPYPNADRLVGVWHTAPGLNLKRLNAAPSTYFTYREESRTFQDSGVYTNNSVSVTGLAEPEQVPCVLVTENVLDILGVPPAHGRLFKKEDGLPNGPKSIILTHGYWQRRFGRDRGVIGQAIKVDGDTFTIVGVMPSHFRFVTSQPSLIMPLRFDRGKSFIGNFSYRGIARLKPGVTLAQANDDVRRMIPMLMSKFAPAPGMSMKMLEEARLGPDVHPLEEDVVGDVGKVLWVLMGSLALLLLIACANVANLMLVRAEGRHQELAIRAALGAGWARIARDLLAESVALGLTGGALGVALAYGAIRLLVAAGPRGLPRLEEVSIDVTVLLFALAISMGASLLFGVIPVIKYVTPHLVASLREGGRALSQSRERHRARNLLVVVQVALALVLLVGAGLMIRTIDAMSQVKPGFTNPEQILTIRISIPIAQVKEDERAVRMQNDIVDRIAALPGVESVGFSHSITMDGRDSNDPIFAEDKVYAEATIPPLRRFKFASPGYFKTMGNPLVAGRDFTWTEIYGKRPVVIVSETLARELWSRPEAALGKRIRENPKGVWREVIGVSGIEHDDGVDKPAKAIVYWPVMVADLWSNPTMMRRGVAIAIRSARTGTPVFLQEVQRAVWSVNPDLPIANVQTVQEIYNESMARTSFTLTIMSIAGAMALLLGLLGIYGVISYSVSQRMREIGIRIALGAQQPQVRRMFVRDGMLLTGIGVVCGLAAAAAAMRLMSALLFGVSAADPLTYIAVPSCLAAAAALACYVPARRASAIPPVEALRGE
jgi:predicted permease